MITKHKRVAQICATLLCFDMFNDRIEKEIKILKVKIWGVKI